MDASEIRRKKRLQAKLSRAKWVIWLVVVALVGFYMYWRTQQVAVARIVGDEFLTRVGRGEAAGARDRLFTHALKQVLPPDKMQKQMALLARKLGHLDEFVLAESELSWDNNTCRLIYDTSFSRSKARTILEIVVDNTNRWKLDTFYIWADTWKQL